jgi:hypothetical protein
MRNEEERARLLALVSRLNDADLRTIVHGDWTVAGKLAHLAFWDRVVLSVLERWVAGKDFRIDVTDWYDDMLNDVVLAHSLALAPAEAVRLAVEAAAALDARLEGLTESEAERLAADAARPETDANWLLHRYRHRAEHLDEVEAALRSMVPAR